MIENLSRKLIVVNFSQIGVSGPELTVICFED